MKTIYTVYDVLFWISLYGILENVFEIFNANNRYTRVAVFIFLLIFSLYMLNIEEIKSKEK